MWKESSFWVRRALITLLAAALGFGAQASYVLAAHTDVDPASTKRDLQNLRLLLDISGIEQEPRILDSIETEKAIIYSLNETEIPSDLPDRFDRVHEWTVDYLNMDEGFPKRVDWVIDFGDLQNFPPRKEACLGGCPPVLAGLYDTLFDYLFFTPPYANDYYLMHELLHHLIDEHEQEVIGGLPEFITKQAGSEPISDFLRKNEEDIVTNLAQVIIRKNLAGFALKESPCVCEPKTVLGHSENVLCTCVKPPGSLIAKWIDSGEEEKCKSCHGPQMGGFTKDSGKRVNSSGEVS